MTVLFVLAMLVIFLTIDYFIQRSRQARTQLSADAARLAGFIPVPAEVGLATNHTWVRNEGRGITAVGLDEFLSRLVGGVEQIMLPEVGARFAPAGAQLTVRHGKKALALSVPVGGRVVAVNTELLRDPSLIRRDPYGKGWMMKVQTGTDRALAATWGVEAATWLKRQSTQAAEFLLGHQSTPQLATLQDGGQLAEGALQGFDQVVWDEFARQFASLRSTN